MVLKLLILNGLMVIFVFKYSSNYFYKIGHPEFGTHRSRILIFFCLIFLLFKIKGPSLSPLICFSLKSIFSDIRIIVPVVTWFVPLEVLLPYFYSEVVPIIKAEVCFL